MRYRSGVAVCFAQVASNHKQPWFREIYCFLPQVHTRTLHICNKCITMCQLQEHVELGAYKARIVKCWRSI